MGRVHAVLKESPRKRSAATRAQTPALLKGLLYGPTGAAMTPTHTRKGGRLYRYYVSADILQKPSSACPICRVPAGDIEAAVIGQLRRLLTAPEIIARTHRTARQTDKTITEREVRDTFHQFDELTSMSIRGDRPLSAP